MCVDRMKKTITIFAAMLLALALDAQGISVMSFNLGETSSDRNWNMRKDAVAGMTVSESPDLIGLQSCPTANGKELEKSLPGYSCVKMGKHSPSDNLIFIRTENSSVLKSGFFSLSDKPENPGSMFSCGTRPCNAVWAVIRLNDGKEVFAVNTCFDAESAEARMLQVKLLVEKIGSLSEGRPCILTGTLNCKPSLWSDKEYGPGYVLKSARILDARQMALGTDSKPSVRAEGVKSKIADYIFYSVDGLSANQFRTIVGTEPLSDHNPIRANLLFK